MSDSSIAPRTSKIATPAADPSTPSSRRVVIVSNRLPFSVQRTSTGVDLVPSSGGLVTALSGYLDRRQREGVTTDLAWVGWAGGQIDQAEVEQLRRDRSESHEIYPLSFEADEMDRFYLGFCNSTIWPLFHYFPSYTSYREEDWETYRRINEQFCDAVANVVRPGDEIWIHDYQLLLLPRLLRERLPAASIGFFLHIPFPSFEVFRQLPTPWRRELLEGVLGADLIGFHTHDYVQHFLHSVFRTLGHEHHLGQLRIAEALKRVESFPIGIDYDRFHQAATSDAVLEARSRLETGIGQRKLICSVDRLDYSKGLLHRLRGYEAFLKAHPEYRGKVTFVLVVVPSREHVERYQNIKQELDELIGQLNGSLGSLDWMPIVYHYRSVSFTELVALYSMADIALITPLRDGMNLVAKEYLASKPAGQGVLILSEVAGAARELGEALQVNPNHAREIAQAIYDALAMAPEEQERRNRLMQERIRTYDAAHWVESFLSALRRTKERQGRLDTLHLTGVTAEQVLQRHHRAARRLLLLDYDGTLVPLAGKPQDATPDARLLELLETLGRAPGQTVYLVSGRDRKQLEQWFGRLPINMIAEHGAWFRSLSGEWTMPKPLRSSWKNQLRPLLQLYVDRVPGSLLEEKDYALVWHYRLADPELGAVRAMELTDDIVSYTANFDVQVLEGKKAIEVRNAGVSKGGAARDALAATTPDFVFAAGDDTTDEELFRALSRDAVTVCVGGTHSFATYRMTDHLELRALLQRFAGVAS
jgi:trehalose 6-phosphate synthase/phosphatase